MGSKNDTMQNLTEQIEDTENKIEAVITSIASMEQQLLEYEGEPNGWYRACEYNLNKAELRKEYLERLLKKHLTSAKELEAQNLAAQLKSQRMDEVNRRQIQLAEAVVAAKAKKAETKRFQAIEVAERSLVEFKRLVCPLLGEEKTYAMCGEAERLALEWVEARKQ